MSLSSYNTSAIDDHYKNSIKLLSPNGDGTGVSVSEKADLASQYKGPIKSLARDIEYGLQSDDPNKLAESVYLFDRVSSENPIALSSIKDKKTLAYASALSNAYKYGTNLTPEGIKQIKASIYDLDGRTIKKRENDFAEKSAFNKDIDNTIAELYQGGDNWYSAPDAVSQDVKAMLRPMLKEAYVMTGNENDAIEMVKKQTQHLFGHSEVNQTPRWGIDSGTIMAVPPEIGYNGKASAKEIRGILNSQIASELPEGVTPDQVMLGSDDLTIQEFRSGKSPSYYMYYVQDGQEVLVPGRFALNGEDQAALTSQREAIVSGGKVDINAGVSYGQVPSSLKKDGSVVTNNVSKNAVKEVLSGTKGFGSSPVLSAEFADAANASANIGQIVSHYKGDQTQRPVVASALASMIGKDGDSWRVGQSLKLINSVLVNNADPRTYLKYGKATTSPSTGDIVVTNNRAGLFGGKKEINGQSMIKITSMVDGELSVDYVPESEIRGYRSLPTPEQFAKQGKALSESMDMVMFNPLTGEIARKPQEGDRFNPLTGELIPAGSDQTNPLKKVLNPVTGQMVIPGQASLKVPANGQAAGQASDQAQPQEDGWWDSVMQAKNNSNSKLGNPTSTPQKGNKVVLKDGTIGMFEEMRNGTNNVSDSVGVVEFYTFGS